MNGGRSESPLGILHSVLDFSAQGGYAVTRESPAKDHYGVKGVGI